MKQLLIGLGIGGIIGGVVGYFSAKWNYEKIVNAAMKEYETAKPNREKKPQTMDDIKATHEDPSDIMKKPDVTATDYTSFFKTEPTPESEEEIPNGDHLVNTEKPDTRTFGEQLQDGYLRDEVPEGEQPLGPIQVELEQIEHSNWECINATYYAGEDKAYDVDGYELDEDDIGYGIRDMFGYGIQQRYTIYIHNEKNKLNYEIEFSEGTYLYH